METNQSKSIQCPICREHHFPGEDGKASVCSCGAVYYSFTDSWVYKGTPPPLRMSIVAVNDGFSNKTTMLQVCKVSERYTGEGTVIREASIQPGMRIPLYSLDFT